MTLWLDFKIGFDVPNCLKSTELCMAHHSLNDVLAEVKEICLKLSVPSRAQEPKSCTEVDSYGSQCLLRKGHKGWHMVERGEK